jgi:acryloyl-coenzyme A reductase
MAAPLARVALFARNLRSEKFSICRRADAGALADYRVYKYTITYSPENEKDADVKAIVLRHPGSPAEALKLEEVPDPSPGPRDVVISVQACGVCYHDVSVRAGVLRAGVAMPCIPGHEVAGEVVAVGSAVNGFRVGDRVASTQRFHICGSCRYCRSAREPLCAEAAFLGDADLNGGYAEYVRIEPDNLARVPENVPYESAAIAACAIGTALHAIREVARLRLGEFALITGAGGGVGIHAVQLAKLAGAFVIAQTTSPEKADAIRLAGADEIVVCQRAENFSAAVRDLSSGGVDVVIDNVGTPQFQATRRCLAPGGRWTMVGQLTGDFAPFNPAQMFLRSISLLSATSTTRAELADVLQLIGRGAVRPQLAQTFALMDAAHAHEALEGGAILGRCLLTPNQPGKTPALSTGTRV